jgi:NADH:quinone reductase (non-electrogenic)
VLNNPGVERIVQIERAKGAALTFADIQEQVAGVYPRIMLEGDVDAGAFSCGMVAGLINDIPTVAELIDRIMADAVRLIRDRLMGLLENAAAPAAKVA